jgi:hypothetical protein
VGDACHPPAGETPGEQIKRGMFQPMVAPDSRKDGEIQDGQVTCRKIIP